MWDRRSILATVALVCVWLAALSGCDAMKSEGLTQREYRRVLVDELCAPGGFYPSHPPIPRPSLHPASRRLRHPRGSYGHLPSHFSSMIWAEAEFIWAGRDEFLHAQRLPA